MALNSPETHCSMGFQPVFCPVYRRPKVEPRTSQTSSYLRPRWRYFARKVMETAHPMRNSPRTVFRTGHRSRSCIQNHHVTSPASATFLSLCGLRDLCAMLSPAILAPMPGRPQSSFGPPACMARMLLRGLSLSSTTHRRNPHEQQADHHRRRRTVCL
jgi:hypothetical protein